MQDTDRSEITRPKRKRVPRAIREPQMLDAATEVFSERGFHAASMDEIAARVSVTKPMLYAYFGSKEGLYSATVNRAGNHIVKLVAGLMTESDPRVRLKKGTDVLFDFVFAQRAAWSVVYNERVGPDGVVDVSSFRKNVIEFLSRTLAEVADAEAGAPSADAASAQEKAEPYAVGLIGSCESLLRWWTKETPFDQEQCRAFGHQLVGAHAKALVGSRAS